MDIADTLKQDSLLGVYRKSGLHTLGTELLSGFGGFKARGGPLESNQKAQMLEQVCRGG